MVRVTFSELIPKTRTVSPFSIVTSGAVGCWAGAVTAAVGTVLGMALGGAAAAEAGVEVAAAPEVEAEALEAGEGAEAAVSATNCSHAAGSVSIRLRVVCLSRSREPIHTFGVEYSRVKSQTYPALVEFHDD